MKVIYFSGYGDYDAIAFEKAKPNLPKLFDRIKNGLETIEWDECEGDVYAYEFGGVDEKFVEFIRNKIQDYDSMKQCNFYIVE